MMFDSARLELGLNALASLEAAGALWRVVIFALDAEVASELDSHGVRSWPFFQTVSRHLPSWSATPQDATPATFDFKDKVLLKYVTFLSALELGYEMLWLDVDLVVFKDPLEAFRLLLAREGGGGFDFAIQTYPGSAVGEPEKVFQAVPPIPQHLLEHYTPLLHPELCTGVLYVAPTALALRFFRVTLRRQVTDYLLRLTNGTTGMDPDVFFDDQIALNEVLFDRYKLGLGRIRIHRLDPFEWASPLTLLSEDHGRRRPMIVYHQFGYGGTHKAKRFKELGLWFLPTSD